MSAHVQAWVIEVAGLPPNSVVRVNEEAHCPDPTCPLRKTILEWADATGKAHRAIIVKPLDYVRRPDVERALRLFLAKN